MEPKVVFIEGVDRSGKGSLAQAIHEATNYKHLIFDRGVFSNMTYAFINGRGDTNYYEKMYEIETKMSKLDHLVVYVNCSNAELIRRCEETGHEFVDYVAHKTAFELFMTNSPMNIFEVNTTNNSPEEIADYLLKQNLI